jgi:pentapeptide MXKDX repeat protein
MRKLIIATAALAFLSSTAFAQDKSTAAPAASGDSMSKSDMSKDKMSKSKSKKSKKSSDDTSK